MQSRQTLAMMTGMSVVIWATCGCSQQTISSAQNDAQHDIAVVNQQADKAVQEAKPQLKKADLGLRVTTALQTADIHGVRVDASTNGVQLRGIVDTSAEKSRAGQIAQDTLGPGHTVTNEIQVKGE